jgi:hypothetical protein
VGRARTSRGRFEERLDRRDELARMGVVRGVARAVDQRHATVA